MKQLILGLIVGLVLGSALTVRAGEPLSDFNLVRIANALESIAYGICINPKLC